jgi:hypothetical protein
MVTKQSIDEQLKKIHFNAIGWGRSEVNELPNIILPDEQIFECVNGIYEGGFALLIATNLRVVLVDKKPMNYLTVEDLRFDMISEIDYGHRLFGARISISTGSKNLRFTSYNQQRLRKLISHVQHHMAESKLKQSEHQEDQRLHLEQINQQLQAYLLAQHQQQEKLQQQFQINNAQSQPVAIEPVKPGPQLSDYLFAQSLMAQHEGQEGQQEPPVPSASVTTTPVQPSFAPSLRPQEADLYAEGLQEVFGKRQQQATVSAPVAAQQQSTQAPVTSFANPLQLTTNAVQHVLDLSPLRIAYSKLPMAMRNRRFGRPSFHAHSRAETDDSIVAVTPSEAAPAPF